MQTDGRFLNFIVMKKEGRINEVIEVAITEFLEKGYENTSMESIAKAANLSKGGLYHYFSSKADILFAVNQKILEPIQDIIVNIDKNPSLTDGLNQFIADYLNYWDNHRREITLYFFTMNISFRIQPLMEYYSEFAKTEFDLFEAYFSRGQQEGIFKPRNARDHAMSLISCIDGYLAYMLILPETKLNNIIAEVQNTFVNDYLVDK